MAVNQSITVGGNFTATATSIQLNKANVTSTGGNIRELLIALTQTEAFLYRPAP